MECTIAYYSDSISIFDFFGGPGPSGKSHTGFYALNPIEDSNKTILASHDSIIYSSNKNDIVNNPITDANALMTGFMKPDGSPNNPTEIFNPIVKAFESTQGRGLAGVITQLDYQYHDSTWETARIGSKSPQYMRVQLTFSPMHD